MKILITGIYGNIGNKVFEQLKDNHEIIGVGKSTYYDRCDKYYSCDISDIMSLERIISTNQDIDIIIHCAALAHNKGNDLSFDKFKEINYVGTVNLVNLSNKYLKLKRFIFLSTISVYGERIDKEYYLESDECIPKSPYAVTKKMAEEYIIDNLRSDFTILRLAPVYSDDFMLNINRRTKIKNFYYVVGTGENKLSLCNIKNITQVISFLIYNLNCCTNETYNLSDSKTYTYAELVGYLNKHRSVFRIPRIFIKMLFNINKVLKSQFIYENSIKLMSNNVYSSKKINDIVKLKFNMYAGGEK